jgi:predicted heme/steroid binding protein
MDAKNEYTLDEISQNDGQDGKKTLGLNRWKSI